MKLLTISNMRRIGVPELLADVPCIIAIDGEEKLMLAPIEGVVVIADMHPHAQKMLKAMEQKIRKGMPGVVKHDLKAKVELAVPA